MQSYAYLSRKEQPLDKIFAKTGDIAYQFYGHTQPRDIRHFCNRYLFSQKTFVAISISWINCKNIPTEHITDFFF